MSFNVCRHHWLILLVLNGAKVLVPFALGSEQLVRELIIKALKGAVRGCLLDGKVLPVIGFLPTGR